MADVLEGVCALKRFEYDKSKDIYTFTITDGLSKVESCIYISGKSYRDAVPFRSDFDIEKAVIALNDKDLTILNLLCVVENLTEIVSRISDSE